MQPMMEFLDIDFKIIMSDIFKELKDKTEKFGQRTGNNNKESNGNSRM